MKDRLTLSISGNGGGEKCIQENGVPLKCLLLLDNASAYSPGLEVDLAKAFDLI